MGTLENGRDGETVEVESARGGRHLLTGPAAGREKDGGGAPYGEPLELNYSDAVQAFRPGR